LGLKVTKVPRGLFQNRKKWSQKIESEQCEELMGRPGSSRSAEDALSGGPVLG
jgi:hypothetical protein